jgi:DNA (cytosine-5)-methyltransferase 1
MKEFQFVDLFCGAGGTSTGAIEAIESLGYSAQLTAINHWPVAIATHEKNHPGARHLCTSIDNIDPRKLYKEGGLDLLWASPECTHHSNARGGRPKNDQSRATAFCVTRWAEALRPPVVLVENVPEFKTWGPLDRKGRPIKSRKGEVFNAWVNMLEAIGYRVESRVLCAADYGDPTTRERLFVQAVRGRRQITWPMPTHSRQGINGFKPWVPAREIIDWELQGESIFERSRPLKPNTLRRIVAGLRKFGLGPFIVPGFGDRVGQTPRTHSVDEPAPTVAAAGHFHLAQPFILPVQSGANRVRGIDVPLQTVTCDSRGIAFVQPFLVAMEHGGGVRDIDRPLPTITTAKGGAFGVCAAALLPQQSGGALRRVDEPAPTVSTDGAIALVEPFLVKYHGTANSSSLSDPLGAITTRDRYGLVRPVVIVDGAHYVLDIRFRMLQPRELAAAQGFRSDYSFTGTKTDQVKQIGNAVPRNLARALVLAALGQKSDIRPHLAAQEIAA